MFCGVQFSPERPDERALDLVDAMVSQRANRLTHTSQETTGFLSAQHWAGISDLVV